MFSEIFRVEIIQYQEFPIKYIYSQKEREAKELRKKEGKKGGKRGGGK